MTTSRCPTCGTDLGGGVVGGDLDVRMTGEFRVPAEVLAAAADDAPAVAAVTAAARCSWCGKDEAKVRKLLGASAVAICEECVALCADVLEAELGPGWRARSG